MSSRYIELAEKATPLPWLLSEYLDITDASGRTSDASDIAFVNHEKENWADEWDGDPQANADLIVALRNAAPDIERLWKAAKDAHGYYRRDDTTNCVPIFVVGEIEHDALQDAVESLRSLFGEEQK